MSFTMKNMERSGMIDDFDCIESLFLSKFKRASNNVFNAIKNPDALQTEKKRVEKLFEGTFSSINETNKQSMNIH
jgi:hypothetical protein